MDIALRFRSPMALTAVFRWRVACSEKCSNRCAIRNSSSKSTLMNSALFVGPNGADLAPDHLYDQIQALSANRAD